MAAENAWGPVITCEACTDLGRTTAAEYALPQTGGTVMLVCRHHAQGWYDEDSRYLLNAARALEPLEYNQRGHLIHTEGDRDGR